MKSLLPTLPKVATSESIDAKLEAGLVDEDGCLLLKSERGLTHAGRSRFLDLTGYEAFVNHLHIEGHLIGPNSDLRQAAAAGMSALTKLRELITSFPDAGPVQVVLSVANSEIPSVTLRFYRRRPGERWISDDLEGYLSEAMLIENIG
jgi:hypothetical protein